MIFDDFWFDLKELWALLESLKSQLGIVALLGRRKAVELDETRMDLVEIVSSFTVDPALVDFVHGPDLVDVLGQSVADRLYVRR